jgi:DNA-binding GntR family transcriptional regulator
LHDEVADRLRELIMLGELAPGERLNERSLTERFGISRTPLREAVKILSAEGLVKLLPNRGAVVSTITRADAENLVQLIGALEALGGELACRRATVEQIDEIAELTRRMRAYHDDRNLAEFLLCNQRILDKIIDAGGNTELSDAYRRTAGRIRRAHYMTECTQARWDESMEEHEKILDALVKRDSDRLKVLLVEHISHAQALQGGITLDAPDVQGGARRAASRAAALVRLRGS